jgi:hypothetical protein
METLEEQTEKVDSATEVLLKSAKIRTDIIIKIVELQRIEQDLAIITANLVKAYAVIYYFLIIWDLCLT